MPMSYTTLVGAKASAGSLLNWVGYNRVDVATVLDEAQLLLYQILRVREMRAEWTFGMAVGGSSVALPARFLDPIGRLFDATNNTYYEHFTEGMIAQRRAYDNSISGTFGTNPFTTILNSSLVTVVETAHGLTQDSTITIAGAPVLNGLTLTGSFPVVSITDANTFVIDSGDTLASAATTGGGAGVTYTGNSLIAGFPSGWAVWGEKLRFDFAFDTACVLKLMYYRQPLLLSSTNLTNFITDRYPKLLRLACMAAAAEYMRDEAEYQLRIQALNNLIQSTAAADDLFYRGANFGTDTP